MESPKFVDGFTSRVGVLIELGYPIEEGLAPGRSSLPGTLTQVSDHLLEGSSSVLPLELVGQLAVPWEQEVLEQVRLAPSHPIGRLLLFLTGQLCNPGRSPYRDGLREVSYRLWR